MLASSASDRFTLRCVAIPMAVLLVNAATVFTSLADVVPNPLFSNGAVLQRDIKLPVWGTANDGENVTIEFAGQRVTTQASQGKWLVHLQPLQASSNPQTLTITGNNRVEIKDLLVGDVWLCSGQSNMEWPIAKSANGRAVAAKIRDPQIRLFEVATTQSLVPLDQAKGRWNHCQGKYAASFSAVAYYFGKDLHTHLKIPIGLIGSYVGASAADRWMSPKALRALNITPTERGPSSLYNGMIAPLQPFPIRGVIWYQGEANRGRPSQYEKLFPALIADWRDTWKQGPFPFLFVQLPPFNAIPPELREIQAKVWKNTAHTGMVVITDHGSPTNIHPPVKEPVGKRLALAARSIAYGEQLVWSGPIYREMSIHQNRAVIHFNSTGSGLTAIPAGDPLKGFTLAGSDGKFLPADATLRGNQIEVSHPSIAKPVAVRFGWAAAPDLNLFNKEGLPAMPFRTDLPQSKL